jgi:hypothetical protein
MKRPEQYVEYALCPAPVPGKLVHLGDHQTNRCLNRLPCHEHNVVSPVTGLTTYGHVYIERFSPQRPSWWRRLTGRAAVT